MIDAKELRIGNWVERTNITYAGAKKERFQVKVLDFIHSDTYEPIPLTTEILERCNMQKRFDTVDCNIWDSIEEPPTRNKAFSLALLTQGWVYLAAPGANAFKNVHQLQNLYYALTNSELTINL